MKGKRVRDLHALEYQQARDTVYAVVDLRHKEKLSQAHVNRRSGYSQSGVSEWEGFKMPNYALVTLIRMARAIGYRVVITFEKEDE